MRGSLELPGEDDAAPSSADTPSAPPLVLASESLREDLEPSEPGVLRARVVAGTVAVLGASSVIYFGTFAPLHFLCLILFSIAAASALLPLGYGLRAGVMTGCALAFLACLMGYRSGLAAGPPWLTLGVMVVAAGLLLRATYRASLTSRALVLLGAVLVLFSFVVCRGWSEWVIRDTRWYSWVPFALWAFAFVLLLLSLLAFMDASSTGGANYWATGWLTWIGAHALLYALLGVMGKQPHGFLSHAVLTVTHYTACRSTSAWREALVIAVVETSCVVLFALGLSQLLGVLRLRQLRHN